MTSQVGIIPSITISQSDEIKIQIPIIDSFKHLMPINGVCFRYRSSRVYHHLRIIPIDELDQLFFVDGDAIKPIDLNGFRFFGIVQGCIKILQSMINNLGIGNKIFISQSL